MTGEPLCRRRWGAGLRTAVLLHGSTSSSNTWWQVAPKLADHGWTVEAFDPPSHGASPPARQPLTPALAAAAVRAELGTRTVDVLVGHSFGAAVAATLAAETPTIAQSLVLEELPGPASVAWPDEARTVLNSAVDARTDRAGAISRTRRDQPRWHDEDCEHAVDDLAGCHPPDIAAGLELGSHWLPLSTMRRITQPVLLLLAPDAPASTSSRTPPPSAAPTAAAHNKHSTPTPECWTPATASTATTRTDGSSTSTPPQVGEPQQTEFSIAPPSRLEG